LFDTERLLSRNDVKLSDGELSTGLPTMTFTTNPDKENCCKGN